MSSDGNPTIELYAAWISELEQTVERLLTIIDALMPGAKHLALQDYKELNDAPIEARRLLKRGMSPPH